MKVTEDQIEDMQAFLRIEMEPAEVEVSLDESYYRLVKKAKIPGFRKGKAPRAVLERHIGKDSLFEDALNHLIPKAYEEAVKEKNIEAIAQPNVEIVQTDPLILKVTVPLRPTIKLGDYSHIQVMPVSVELTDDNVSSVIEQLRHQHATWEPVEHPVDYSDLAVLDIESNIEDKPFINQRGAQYQVLYNPPFPVPGFSEKLIGMKRGEDKEFKLQLPSDYPQVELAGKEPSFKVKVTEIKQEILPEINDEFAGQVDSEFKTLDSLRERVSINLRRNAEEKARVDFEEQVMDAVVDLCQVEFPTVLVEAEIDRLINQQARQWQMSGRSLEEYLKSVNKTEEELREELHPIATKRVIRSLVLGKIAEEENIEVSDDEINTESENMTKGTDESKKDELQGFFNTPQARESVKQVLLTRKTIELLVGVANSLNKNIKTTRKGEKK